MGLLLTSRHTSQFPILLEENSISFCTLGPLLAGNGVSIPFCEDTVFQPYFLLQELMGRPLRLKFSEKNVDDSGSQREEQDDSESQPEES